MGQAISQILHSLASDGGKLGFVSCIAWHAMASRGQSETNMHYVCMLILRLKANAFKINLNMYQKVMQPDM